MSVEFVIWLLIKNQFQKIVTEHFKIPFNRFFSAFVSPKIPLEQTFFLQILAAELLFKVESKNLRNLFLQFYFEKFRCPASDVLWFAGVLTNR
jgi:hypothetical protein